jgi:hypothetical protein
MRHSAAGAMAVALDVGAWGRAPGAPLAGASGAVAVPAVPWLTSHGWRAVAAGPRDPLPTVWQELGLLGRSATTRSQAATVSSARGVL